MKLEKFTYKPFGLEAIETASRDEIAAVQTKRLKRTLENVYENVPLYRKKFDTAGVTPSDFKQLDDLKKFPFTTKEDLRENYPFGMFAVPRERVLRVHASSGTTGKPTVVGYTRRDIDTWADLVARSLRACGARPGMLVHIAVGYGLFTGGLGMHYGAERLGCTVIPVASGMTARQVQLILDFQPDVIVPTPSYLLVILDEFRAQGLDPSRTSLKIAFCGAEPWTNLMRAEIESAFDIDPIDAYGLSEVIGPGVACECIETKRQRMAHTFGRIIFILRSLILILTRYFATAKLGRSCLLLLRKRPCRDTLPNSRSHSLTTGRSALNASNGESCWPIGRHAHHPRRKCLSDAD